MPLHVSADTSLQVALKMFQSYIFNVASLHVCRVASLEAELSEARLPSSAALCIDRTESEGSTAPDALPFEGGMSRSLGSELMAGMTMAGPGGAAQESDQVCRLDI